MSTHEKHIHNGNDENELGRVLPRAWQEDVDSDNSRGAQHGQPARKQLEYMKGGRHNQPRLIPVLKTTKGLGR